MSRTSEFLNNLKEKFEKIYSTIERKNHDYCSGGVDDPFRNFELSADIAGVETERGILVRLADKIVRLGGILDNAPLVTDEKFEDTAADASAYAAILSVYHQMKKEEIYIDGDYLNGEVGDEVVVPEIKPTPTTSKMEDALRKWFKLEEKK